MSIKVSVYIATSLDGFIARTNGDLDWLASDEIKDEDYGYEEFISTIDTIILGRQSFEKVLSFGDWPYGGKRVVVLSRGRLTIPGELKGQVEVSSAPLQELMRRLEETGARHLYVDGGKTIQSFLSAGLVQELTITTIPRLIGEGIPLFGCLEHDIKLEHLHTQTFANGLVQTKYKVVHE